jgi:ribose transport system permease protein
MTTTTATETTAQVGKSTPVAAGPKESALVSILRKWGTIFVILLTGAAFSMTSEYFFAYSNINNILFSMIVSAMVSVGLTYVVVVGSFDLSVGLITTTTSVITALMIPRFGAPVAVLIGLGCAAAIGLINGLLVTYGRLSGIVVTLAMGFVLGGINIFMTGGYQVAVDYNETAFLALGQGKIEGVAYPVIICLVVFIAAHFLGAKTRIGHYITAVGDNPLAAYYSGISVYRWVIVSFVLASTIAGIGGVLMTAISSSAQPVGGQGYLLEAFAAVFLGATVLGKGKPHIFGTILGVFFIYMVSSGMSMAGFPFAARQLFSGIVLILAVGANAMLNREELHMKFI